MASVKLKNIFKRFPGGVTAVNDFNLDIEDKNLSYWLDLLDVENYNS